MGQILFIGLWILIIAGVFSVLLGVLTVIGLLDVFFSPNPDEYSNLDIFEGDRD